jgi:hypothetical protein
MLRKLLVPRRLLIIGGMVASAFLIVFGTGSIVVGVQGRAEVRDNLARENIVGTDDSTIPGQLVDTGSEARAFADVMRAHTLERTDGKTYSQIERYLDANGNPTNDASQAAKTPSGANVENPLRQLWITETALTTALNTAYLAEQVGTFVIFMGVALLFSGIGFGVLTVGALRHGLATEAQPGPAARPAYAP